MFSSIGVTFTKGELRRDEVKYCSDKEDCRTEPEVNRKRDGREK